MKDFKGHLCQVVCDLEEEYSGETTARDPGLYLNFDFEAYKKRNGGYFK